METIDLAGYPPAIQELLRVMPVAPLGPGDPHRELRDRLEAVGSAFPPGASGEMVAACRAGLWLAFDFLEEAHEISQGIDTREGSYWHALMHRREPDHSNAAYWLRRVGAHPIFADLARAAADLGYAGNGAGWDAFAFNDACEAHRGKGDAAEELLRRVQRAEWELLFAYCFERATGGAEGR